MKKPLLCLLAIIFISIHVYAQPGNNTCGAGSPLLTSGRSCVTTTGTVANATLDGTINTCAGTERYDVWYRFQAQSSNPTIRLSNLGTNFTSPGLQVSSGCGGVALACGTTSVSPTGLTIGLFYHIRVFSTAASTPTNNANFDICIIDPPPNDLCAFATNLGTLTGNYVATPGDLYNADATAAPTGTACAGTRYDVWYRFTLPAGSTSAIINVVLNLPNTGTGSLTNTNTFIEVFNTNGCTLNGTSTGGCNNVSQPRKYTGLTNGGTYTFRVNTTQNPNVLIQPYYGFNLFVVPNNDQCTNVATILPAGGTVIGDLLGATNSGLTAAPCTGTADDDVWYTFTALYNYATITLSNIGSDLAASGARMQLFSGTCGSLVSMACSGNTNVINTTAVVATNPYYIRVYSAGANPQTGTAWGYRISLSPSAKVQVVSSRMKEVFNQQIISAPQILADPWEITFGPDNNLWITESKGYRVTK